MDNVGWLIAALAAAHLCALATPLVWLRGLPAAIATALGCAAVAVCPLLVPVECREFRALAALFAGDHLFKLIDFRRHVAHAREPAKFRDFAGFLIPFPLLVTVYADRKWHSPWQGRSSAGIAWRASEIAAAGLWLIAGVGGMFWLLANLSRAEIFRESFVLDHLKIVILFALAAETLPGLLHRWERLCGYDVPPLVRHALISRTVGEYWRRYNTRIHDWLADNVFFPSGGPRHPTRGVFLVFLVSGLIHELMFGIAIGRFDGSQLSFFVLQAPGVWLSEYLKPLIRRGGAWGATLARLATFTWFAVTSVFFFHTVNKLFPFFYAGSHSGVP
jgi:hypothetical protein